MDLETRRLAELAAFLRDRRSRVAPRDVGLPCESNRRVKGLRREEVAELAHVSVTWYTWLEQGRPIHVSAQTLNAIATTLCLSDEERAYLFRLAGVSWLQSFDASMLSPLIQGVLDGYRAGPAFVLGPCLDTLAWNDLAALIYGFSASLDHRERNVVWRLFTDPTRRSLYGERWRQVALADVAELRLMYAESPHDSNLTSFISDLRAASSEFEALWLTQPLPKTGQPDSVSLNEPRVGRLEFSAISTRVSEATVPSLIFFVPVAGSGTAERLQALRELQH